MKKLTENLIQQRIRSCTTDLDKVLQINITGRELEDVSLLRKMTGVEILSLSVNKISTLADFEHCKNLKELYLRHNNIANINEICFLQGLPKLQLLMLSENPICEDPLYRLTVIKNLKYLVELDGILITIKERREATKNGKEIAISLDASKSFKTIPDGPQILRAPTKSIQKLDHSDGAEVQILDEKSINENVGDYETLCTCKSDKAVHKTHFCSSEENLDQTIKKKPRCEICGEKNQIHQKLVLKEDHFNEKQEETTAKTDKFYRSSSIKSVQRSTCDSHYSRINPKNPNILSAILNLLKELDYNSLQVVHAEVVSRLDSFEVDFLFHKNYKFDA